MKIVVSTFNNSKNNYGALFQSCALYSFLSKMGYDVSYITLEERINKNQSNKNKLKVQLKKVLLLPHIKKIKNRKIKFKRFVGETQKQIIYKTNAELYSNPPKADVYISGSDQVWNPVAMHEDLFLTYAPTGSKKISYAASMGKEKIPAENRECFAELISEYSAVSVREDTVAEIVKEFTSAKIHQNIDPVFLKSKVEWQKLEKPYNKLKFQKFILVYAIEWNTAFNELLADLKKNSGLPVVSINIGNIKKICADKVIYDASPSEFLYLLNKAQCVVATSFHGIAMSIVYNKPFLALAGRNMPTRIQSLMRHFGMDVSKSLGYTADDYERINEIILKDQKEAEEYLRNAIESR